MPPPSKIPSSAVEMPGESLARLDVQFGGLDLQFGGNSSADPNNSNAAAAAGSGFEFNGSSAAAPASASEDKFGGDKTQQQQPAVVSVNAAPNKPLNTTSDEKTAYFFK